MRKHGWKIQAVFFLNMILHPLKSKMWNDSHFPSLNFKNMAGRMLRRGPIFRLPIIPIWQWPTVKRCDTTKVSTSFTN